MNTLELLMNKAKKNELAHFYIIESPLPEEQSTKALMDFVHQFIRDYYQKIEGHKQSLTNLKDHPDVFVLGNLPGDEDPEDAFFKVEEAEGLARFFEFKSVQSKRKFAVITEGHRINTIVANKWLKLLEEPQGVSTIFLLNPRRQKLLDTIHSRALHLRLPVSISPTSLDDWKEFLQASASQSLSQFIENNIREDRDVSYWSNELIRWEADQMDLASSKMALTEWLKKLQEMEIFHQPSATKWALFYYYLQQHVFSRS